jgi:hypothetical protein
MSLWLGGKVLENKQKRSRVRSPARVNQYQKRLCKIFQKHDHFEKYEQLPSAYRQEDLYSKHFIFFINYE